MNSKDKNDYFSEVHQFKISKLAGKDKSKCNNISTNDCLSSSEKQPNENHISVYNNSNEPNVPVSFTGENIIKLIPKMCIIDKKNSSNNTKLAKKPKFIPYEPYKAATNPISKEHYNKFRPVKFVADNKNVEDLMPIKKLFINDNQNQQLLNNDFEEIKWEKEKEVLLHELNRLKEQNTNFENQLNFQTQVNTELKKLLVAAVGEDIETRVQLLTEDKLHLAKELLKTAKTLSTHQEQIEWLAGQCEVWRSKFLASSILVEDLAKWKAGLCQKVTDFENVVKGLLEDRDKIRSDSFKTFTNLSTLQEKFNLNVLTEDDYNCQLLSSNSVELCTSNRHLSELLIKQLLHEKVKRKCFELDSRECFTSSEKTAEQMLSQPMTSFKNTDVACDAVMTGAALALTSSSPSCSHCNGTIKTI